MLRSKVACIASWIVEVIRSITYVMANNGRGLSIFNYTMQRT